MAYRPETAKPLRELAEVLLRGENSLTSAERETIAAFVSAPERLPLLPLEPPGRRRASSRRQLRTGGRRAAGPESAPVSAKLKALLAIAGKVQQGGRHVTADDVARARAEGATDLEIHDTVLIAAAFCMYNRYVDGLATWTPTDPALYDAMGQRMAGQGYVGISAARRRAEVAEAS